MKIRFFFVFNFLFLSFLLFFGCSIVLAQTITGSLAGKVIDEQNNPLSGVLIRLYNLKTGFDYVKLTDQEGLYRIDFLLSGEYRITASKTGYQVTEIPRYLIEVNKQKTIIPPPIQLIAFPPPVTSTTSNSSNISSPITPNISTDTLQVNVVDATLRGSFSETLISNLPLFTRSFDGLALLVPGVTNAPKGLSSFGIGAELANINLFSVNGNRPRNNNFTIDGADNNDQDIGIRRQGFTITTPQTIESIKEFQISTLLADAESGRNTGGQINVVSKMGTNSFYGNLNNYLTNSKLNARDFFDYSGDNNPKKNPFTRNQFAGTLGFPIKQNKLQFFSSFEALNINKEQETHFVVPTFIDRQKAFNLNRSISRLGGDVLDPTFYPFPNNPGGPYGDNTLTKILSAGSSGVLFSTRLDGKISLLGKEGTFNARYNFTDDETRIPAIDNAINSSIKSFTRAQNLVLALNLLITNRISSQARFSYGRTSLNFAEVAGSPLVFQSQLRKNDRTGDGLPDGSTGPVGRILFVPFSPIGVDPSLFPQGRVNNTFQVANTSIINFDKHLIKLGFDLRRVQLNSFLDRNYRTQIAFVPGIINKAFSNRFVGTGVDFAALGLPTSISQALAIKPDSSLALRFTEANFFLQDQFRLHPRVTLSWGLRYERNTVPTDATGRLERSLSLKDVSSLEFDPSSLFANKFFQALNAQRVFLAGRDKIYSPDSNNFAPRISIAWDLSGNGRTSLRIGYGIFYDPILGVVVNQSRNAFPNFIPINFGASIVFPQILSANPAFLRFNQDSGQPVIVPGTINTLNFPSGQLIDRIGKLISVGGFFIGAGFGAGVTLPDKNLRSPYVNQFSVSLEKVFSNQYTVSLAYVTTVGRKLIRVRTPNGGQFPTVQAGVGGGAPVTVLPLLKRPNPALDTVTSFESSADSTYHSLQTTVNKAINDKFFFQLAYTYSHAIDEMSDIFDTGGNFSTAQNELDALGLKAEKASASFDVRHRFTALWQYQLFPGTNFVGNIFSGIKLSGILTLQTGQPFTVNTSLDVNQDGNLSDRLDNLNALQTSDHGRTRLKLTPGMSALSLLALSGENGFVGRNAFQAAGTASLDLAMSKQLELSKKQRVNLKIEVFNVFNRTHFGVPVRVLETPGFGSSVNTSLPSRTIQIVVGYAFGKSE